MKMMMTNELPAEIMENGIHYTLVGDYYFPTCMLADRSPNGKWASLYERYLQEKHPHEYVRLIWADELAALLESVQKECEERVEVLVREMAEVEGVDEEMKHFPDHIGHTNEACAAYRDQMLIELLKLHKKL